MTNESTAVAKVAPHELVNKSEIILLPPETILPAQAELKLMQLIAASVIGAAGEAVPKSLDTIPKAMAVMLAGWELGFRPMSALRHFFTINGRTEPDAQAMASVVLSRDPGTQFIWHEYSHDACDVEMRRPGRNPIRVRYTKQDAEKSGQLAKGGPWKSYTRDMLAWSCMKRCCRLGAPELINLPSLSLAQVTELVEALGPVDEPARIELSQLDGPPIVFPESLNEGDDAEHALFTDEDDGPDVGLEAALSGLHDALDDALDVLMPSEAREEARAVRADASRSYPSPAHAALVADLEARFPGAEPLAGDWLQSVGVVVKTSIPAAIASLTDRQAVRVRELLQDAGPAQGELV